MTERVGDWIQTFSGRCFWPLDPRVEDIDILDIAHSLAYRCRFGGHCTKFYSVAEHSVLVSQHVPPEFALWGLLHDAAEAYTADIPRPLKRNLPFWKPIEQRIMNVICEKYNLSYSEPSEVKHADLAITSDEREVLMNPCDRDWGALPDPIGAIVRGLSPEDAKIDFLHRFYGLTSPTLPS